MQRSLRTKWIAALKSGKYKQGHQYLCEIEENGDKKYCCVGVLCDILALPSKIDIDPRNPKHKVVKYEKSWACLSAEKEIELKIADYTGRLYYYNDDSNWPFTKIADWIEQNIPAED